MKYEGGGGKKGRKTLSMNLENERGSERERACSVGEKRKKKQIISQWRIELKGDRRTDWLKKGRGDYQATQKGSEGDKVGERMCERKTERKKSNMIKEHRSMKEKIK